MGRLPAEILDVVTKLPGAVEALTGVSITQVSGVGGTEGWGAQRGVGWRPLAPSPPALSPHRRRSRSRTAWPELMSPTHFVPHKCQRPTVPPRPTSAAAPRCPNVLRAPPDPSQVPPPHHVPTVPPQVPPCPRCPPKCHHPPASSRPPNALCAPQVPPPHGSLPPKCLQTTPLGHCAPKCHPPQHCVVPTGVTPPPPQGDLCVCPHVCTSAPRH